MTQSSVKCPSKISNSATLQQNVFRFLATVKTNSNMYKETFKYYKSKRPEPKLDKVLDFNNSEELILNSKIKLHNVASTKNKGHPGLKPIRLWDLYTINEHPGLIFIKNPFTSLGQRYWSVRCLQDYSKKPNKSNLDPLKLVPHEKDWWELCQSPNDQNNNLLKKLRWITLGYHHDWDTKIYSENSKSDFPADLNKLCEYVAEALGFTNFNAEAAIVNYYHMDSTLSGHTDHSEQNLEAPLLSFSFGQTAIFLLGGKTKEDPATPIFLRSGDIVIMSKESRLCYHGVPKILHAESKVWEDFDGDEDFGDEGDEVVKICKSGDSWRVFGEYLKESRININVRQVLKRGQKRLNVEVDDK